MKRTKENKRKKRKQENVNLGFSCFETVCNFNEILYKKKLILKRYHNIHSQYFRKVYRDVIYRDADIIWSYRPVLDVDVVRNIVSTHARYQVHGQRRRR